MGNHNAAALHELFLEQAGGGNLVHQDLEITLTPKKMLQVLFCVDGGEHAKFTH